MNSIIRPAKLGFVILTALIISGCWWTHREINESCFQPTFIQSSDNMVFYLIEIGNNAQYSSLNNTDEEDNYLCSHDATSQMLNQCSDKGWYVNKTTELATGSKIELDGVAVYTVKWGLITIDSGPSPTTWFRGTVQGKTIWIATTQLLRMFEGKSDFKASNSEAFDKLKFSKRIPPPIEHSSDGSPIHESLLEYWDLRESQISKWKCD